MPVPIRRRMAIIAKNNAEEFSTTRWQSGFSGAVLRVLEFFRVRDDADPHEIDKSRRHMLLCAMGVNPLSGYVIDKDTSNNFLERIAPSKCHRKHHAVLSSAQNATAMWRCVDKGHALSVDLITALELNVTSFMDCFQKELYSVAYSYAYGIREALETFHGDKRHAPVTWHLCEVLLRYAGALQGDVDLLESVASRAYHFRIHTRCINDAQRLERVQAHWTCSSICNALSRTKHARLDHLASHVRWSVKRVEEAQSKDWETGDKTTEKGLSFAMHFIAFDQESDAERASWNRLRKRCAPQPDLPAAKRYKRDYQ